MSGSRYPKPPALPEVTDFHPARLKIQRLSLIAHHKTSQRAAICYSDMQRDFPVRIRDRTTDRHPRGFIKGLLAENQCWPPASLLMAGLRVKIQRYQITLFGNVRGHLPDFATTRLTEEFLRLIAARHLGHQILNLVPPADSDCFL